MDDTREIAEWVEQHRAELIGIAEKLWENPEVAWEEHASAETQARFLEDRGFTVTRNAAGIPTAFVAEWGAGKPVFGFVGEYDALPGLSQSRNPYPDPVREGGPGHGCGHNLLGTGCLAAAVAARAWCERHGITATIRYYGCPAEERISGKTFMARSGLFNDLDAAFNYHPDTLNMPGTGTSVGVKDITFHFTGIASHAGGAPEKGRSALDAVELMNVGVNYLREHVPEKVRIHYAITMGGDAPNIVPAEAEVWYFIRALEPDVHDSVAERVRKIARGAALMTETEVRERFNGACSSMRNNRRLAGIHYDVMREIGPVEYTSEELDLARSINSGYPKENTDALFENLRIPPELNESVAEAKRHPLVGLNFPSMDAEVIGTGSTDVGDVSRITPLCMLRTACFPTGAAGHSWGVVAASGSSIGHKGMLHAGKIMAGACAALLRDPELLKEVRREFDEAAGKEPYVCPLPDDLVPPVATGS